MPKYLIAFVTGQCNMNCLYCCDVARNVRKQSLLTPDDWAYAVQGANSLVHLTISGGEPFMRNDLGKLISSMIDSSGISHVSINTNGYYSDYISDTVKNILGHYPHIHLTVAVSIDGPPEVHNKLRNTPLAAEKALNTVARLKKIRGRFPTLNIRLQSLLVPENYHIIENFLSDSSGWNIDFHEIVFPRDFGDNKKNIDAVIQLYKRLSKKKLSRNKTLENSILRVLNKNISTILDGCGKGWKCQAGGKLVEVLPNGTVLGCEMTKVKGQSKIGTTGKSGLPLVDICKSSEAKKFRKEIAMNCSCTFECAHLCNIVFNPSNWPSLLLPSIM